jgi:hypothetical protein
VVKYYNFFDSETPEQLSEAPQGARRTRNNNFKLPGSQRTTLPRRS